MRKEKKKEKSLKDEQCASDDSEKSKSLSSTSSKVNSSSSGEQERPSPKKRKPRRDSVGPLTTAKIAIRAAAAKVNTTSSGSPVADESSSPPSSLPAITANGHSINTTTTASSGGTSSVVFADQVNSSPGSSSKSRAIEGASSLSSRKSPGPRRHNKDALKKKQQQPAASAIVQGDQFELPLSSIPITESYSSDSVPHYDLTGMDIDVPVLSSSAGSLSGLLSIRSLDGMSRSSRHRQHYHHRQHHKRSPRTSREDEELSVLDMASCLVMAEEFCTKRTGNDDRVDFVRDIYKGSFSLVSNRRALNIAQQASNVLVSLHSAAIELNCCPDVITECQEFLSVPEESKYLSTLEKAVKEGEFAAAPLAEKLVVVLDKLRFALLGVQSLPMWELYGLTGALAQAANASASVTIEKKDSIGCTIQQLIQRLRAVEGEDRRNVMQRQLFKATFSLVDNSIAVKMLDEFVVALCLLQQVFPLLSGEWAEEIAACDAWLDPCGEAKQPHLQHLVATGDSITLRLHEKLRVYFEDLWTKLCAQSDESFWRSVNLDDLRRKNQSRQAVSRAVQRTQFILSKSEQPSFSIDQREYQKVKKLLGKTEDLKEMLATMESKKYALAKQIAVAEKNLNRLEQSEQERTTVDRSDTSTKSATFRIHRNLVELTGVVCRASASSGCAIYTGNVDGWGCCVKELVLATATTPQIQGFRNEIALLEYLPHHQNIIRYFYHVETKDAIRLFMQRYQCSLRALLEDRHEQAIKQTLESLEPTYPSSSRLSTSDSESAAVPATSSTVISISQILRIFLDTVRAVEFLHSQSILHLDIKSENVFITLDRAGEVSYCVLGDFDSGCYVAHARPTRVLGSPGWTAPEVLEADSETPYSYPADVFSLGMVMYELLTGKTPFFEVDYIRINELVQNGIAPVIPKTILDDKQAAPVLAIFRECTATLPSHRPSATELKKKLVRLC